MGFDGLVVFAICLLVATSFVYLLSPVLVWWFLVYSCALDLVLFAGLLASGLLCCFLLLLLDLSLVELCCWTVLP